MDKRCKICDCVLTKNNAAKKNKKYYRNVCKACRSKKQVHYHKNMSEEKKNKRKAYMRSYLRATGKVKEYPCEYCGQLCYKKYAKAFCSDKCRFMSYVQKTNDCWLWMGSKTRGGYGKFSSTSLGMKQIGAHRFSYIIHRGVVPDAMCVCHTCDNPSCVNPQHLWIGTSAENSKDRCDKGRTLKKEVHPLSKLTDRIVKKIRALNKMGMKQKEIAKLFNVSAGHINNIVKYRIWK